MRIPFIFVFENSIAQIKEHLRSPWENCWPNPNLLKDCTLGKERAQLFDVAYGCRHNSVGRLTLLAMTGLQTYNSEAESKSFFFPLVKAIISKSGAHRSNLHCSMARYFFHVYLY